jgi:protein-L-isoaspartate O-methyltransferase
LKDSGYQNLTIYHGDSFLCWLEQAPFDGLLVAATGERILENMIEQLKPNMIMMVSFRRAYDHQTFCLMRKRKAGAVAVNKIF